jgi:pimeloyl-ACP methyl ester carboxylesterase
MGLFYRKQGTGYPIIILHGLYGSSDNWLTIAKYLSFYFQIWLLDLRNHGRSPHFPTHTYKEMADDVYFFMKENNIVNPIIVGHSMGGKVAMTIARYYPQALSKLIIVDIAPVNYSKYNIADVLIHEHIIDSLLNLNLNEVKQLKDADNLLSSYIKDEKLRLFLLKNLKKEKDKYHWQLNLKVLKQYLPHIIDGFEDWQDVTINIPTYFFKGEYSSYINEKFYAIINNIFKNTEIILVPNAGHWLHSENTEFFVKKVIEITNEYSS